MEAIHMHVLEAAAERIRTNEYARPGYVPRINQTADLVCDTILLRDDWMRLHDQTPVTEQFMSQLGWYECDMGDEQSIWANDEFDLNLRRMGASVEVRTVDTSSDASAPWATFID